MTRGSTETRDDRESGSDVRLTTRQGSCAITRKEPGVRHVRVSERQGPENLRRRAPLPEARIVETKDADYANAHEAKPPTETNHVYSTRC